MTITREELRRLVLPLAAAMAMLAAGIAAIWASQGMVRSAQAALDEARQARKETVERLARIAEEEREVKQKLDVYRQLKSLNVLGDERRLEWADAIARIRKERDLLDLRYRVERQKLLTSVSGKPGNVDFFASTMNVDLALLHEGDLVRFLSDLRASGNAYYSVRRCQIERSGQSATGTTITPRLHAACQIDLITIVDGAAKR